jgi:Na+-driven multidrug efflux pump
VRVIGSYIYAYTLGFGVIGIWYGMVTDWFVRTAFYATRWARGRWQQKNILADRECSQGSAAGCTSIFKVLN